MNDHELLLEILERVKLIQSVLGISDEQSADKEHLLNPQNAQNLQSAHSLQSQQYESQKRS